MKFREPSSELQAAAAGETRKVGGALPATQLHFLCPKLLWRPSKTFFAETDSSSQQHFCKLLSFNAAKQSSHMQHSSCPHSQLREVVRALEGILAAACTPTGFHFTRKNCHLLPGWTTAQIATEKHSAAIHNAIQSCYKTNSTIKWGSSWRPVTGRAGTGMRDWSISCCSQAVCFLLVLRLTPAANLPTT